MDRSKWNQLLGDLRVEIMERDLDPSWEMEADGEEKEIRLRDHQNRREGDWSTFHVDQADPESAQEQARGYALIAGFKED